VVRKNSQYSPSAADLAAFNKRHFEEFATQSELFEQFQAVNQQWVDRMRAEANFSSEFVSKLLFAKSISDVIKACQELGSQRLEMIADDTMQVMNNTHRFLRVAHIFANGIVSKSTGQST
jgi:hypothetical protein